MPFGIEDERHREAGRDCGNKHRQNPFGRVVGGHDRRASVDDQRGNGCIPERDAIDLPLLKLTEERVHLSPRRVRSIGCSIHSVELRTITLFCSPA
jgi:hypothetical protein